MAAIPGDTVLMGGLGSKSHGKASLLSSPALTAADVKHIFQVTAKNGFLPLLAPLRKLPHEYAELEDIMKRLPALLSSPDPSALLTAVAALPAYEGVDTTPPVVLQTLMRDYSILVSAILLEGKQKAGKPRDRVPANVAVPFTRVARKLEEQWIMSYDSYCLTNCISIKEAPHGDGAELPQALSTYVAGDEKWHWENLRLIRAFDGGAEEYTFICVHYEIESNTPHLVAAYDAIVDAVHMGSAVGVSAGLTQLKTVMEHIIVSQLKMFNASDPKNYEKFVRPWIFGWKGNADFDHGVVFEGTDTPPTFLRGETGAQSTIIPSLDIMLGITHKADELRAMLQDLELYRPKPQRDFLATLRVIMWGADVGAGGGEDASGVLAPHLLRDFVRATGDKALARLFNECVAYVWAFRDIHVTYASLYIGKYTNKETATGGTPYKAYLRKHRDESINHQVTDLGDECIVRFEIPSTETFQTEIDEVVKPTTRNGIPAHLLRRHAGIIESFGKGSASLREKSFPTGAEWVNHGQ